MGERNDRFASSDPRWPVDRTTDSDWEDITLTEAQAAEWLDSINDALSREGRKIEKSSKVLEIGTGRGVFLEFLHRKGYDVVGLDARPRHEETLPIAAGKAEKLPFPDSIFDYVLSRGAFSRLYRQDAHRMLQEVYRVLKPRAIFCGLPREDLLEYPGVKMSVIGMTPTLSSTRQYKIYEKTG